MKFTIALVIFYVVCSSKLFSDEPTFKTDTISIVVEKGESVIDILEKNTTFDTVQVEDSISSKIKIDSTNKFTSGVGSSFVTKPYTYAGGKRYTVDGGVPNSKSSFDFVPATITVGITTAACTGLYLYQKNAWWSNNRSSFHIQEDGDYSLRADKLGHFYGGYVVSYLFGEGMIASGLNLRTAHALGTLGGLLYQTFVEIQDGYGSNWGFSPSDAISNYLGAWYYLALNEIPFLQNFTPKVQFVPSRWAGDLPMKHETAVFDDYHSMTYHLSIELDNILPNALRNILPDWLNLSLGYNVRNMEYFDVQGNSLRESNFVIALDYNLLKLIPESDSNFLNWLVQTLNHYKLPSPAIVIGKEVKFALLFPFLVF